MPLRRSRRVYLQPHCCTSWSTGPACAFQLGEESFLIPAPRLFKKLPPLYTRSPQPALLVESRCTTSWGRSPAGGDKAISSGSNEAPPEELLSCYTSLSRVTPPPHTHTHSASLHRISYQKASCHPAKWTHNCSQAAAAKKGGTWEQNQQPEQPGNRTRARGLSGERSVTQTAAPGADQRAPGLSVQSESRLQQRQVCYNRPRLRHTTAQGFLTRTRFLPPHKRA